MGQLHPARKGCKPPPPKGATLVEILVALAILAVYAAGTTGLAVTLLTANAKARSMDIAVYLAHDRLETIRNTDYASITAERFPTQGYGSITVGDPAVAFPEFQRSVTIQENLPISGMKRVLVTVSWAGGSVSEEMVVGQ